MSTQIQRKPLSLNLEMAVIPQSLLIRMEGLERTIESILRSLPMSVRSTLIRSKTSWKALYLLYPQTAELILKALAKEQAVSSMKCLCKHGKEANPSTR